MNQDIDVIELIKVLWNKKGYIIKWSGGTAFIGLIFVFLVKSEYSASCELMSEEANQTGGFGSFAFSAFSGLNSGSDDDAILPPSIYPEIAESKPFQLELLKTPIVFLECKDTLISSYDYFDKVYSPSLLELMKEYSIGLPGKLLKFVFGEKEEVIDDLGGEILFLSRKDNFILNKYFNNRILVEYDEASGIISIETSMPDRYAAAVLAQEVVKKLKAEIIKYKTEKAKQNLDFIEDRYFESKMSYEQKQVEFANFVDSHLNVSTAIASVERQRLQNDLSVSFAVYQNIANKLESARVKVKESTPVFTTIEPVKVPSGRSFPNLILFVIVGGFLGGFVAIGILVLRILFI